MDNEEDRDGKEKRKKSTAAISDTMDELHRAGTKYRKAQMRQLEPCTQKDAGRTKDIVEKDRATAETPILLWTGRQNNSQKRRVGLRYNPLGAR